METLPIQRKHAQAQRPAGSPGLGVSWVWTIVPWACCREMARVESRQTSLQGARFGGPRCWGMRTVTDSARRRGVAGRAGLCSWTLRSQFYVFLTCHKIILLFEPFKNAENILCSSAVKRRWQMGWDLWAAWGPPRLGPGGPGGPRHRRPPSVRREPLAVWRHTLCPCAKRPWLRGTCLPGDSYPAASACVQCARGERPGRDPLCGTRGSACCRPARLSPEWPARATPRTRVSMKAEAVPWATVICSLLGWSELLESTCSDPTCASWR